MKGKSLLIGLLVMVIILSGCNQKQYEEQYPALKDTLYKKTEPFSLYETKVSPDGKLSLVEHEGTPAGYLCTDTGENADFIEVSSSPAPPGMIGGWSYTYVIDCRDLYWVFVAGDFGPRFYGPFEK